MTPLVWKLTVDSSEALAQVKNFAADATALSKSAPPIVLRMDVSAVVNAQQQAESAAAKAASAAEKAAERAAIAAEKAAAREVAAAEKAARSSEAAIDRQVNAELRAAERQIAADERRAASAEKSRLREEAAAIKAAERAAAANEKARLREEAAATRAAEKAAVAAEKAAAREVAAQERKAKAAASAAEAAARREETASQAAIFAAEKQEIAQEKAYQKAAAEAEKAAERVATAQQRLSSLAAGTPAEKASSDFARRKAEIQALAALTGDQTTADKALKIAQQDVARSLVQTGIAGEVAGAGIAKGSGKAGAAVGMLGMQLSDVASQLTTGTNPFTILIQQGPQVAYAIEQGGGAAAIFNGTLGSVGITAGVVATAVAALTVAVAAGATAYSVFANAAMTSESEAYNLNETIYQQGIDAVQTADNVKALDQAWSSFTGSMQTAQEYIAVVNGDLEEWEVKAGKATRAVIDGTHAQIQSEADHIASLKKQKDAVQAMIDSDRASASELPELFARRKALNNQIETMIPVLEEHKAAVQATIDATIQAATKEEEERKAKEAQTKAHKGHTAALKEEEEWLRAINARMAEENRLAMENEKNYKAATNAMDEIGAAATERARHEKTASEKIVADYNEQIRKIKELQQAASNASVGGATGEADRTAALARLAAEKSMQAQLSQIRDTAALDGLALQNKTAEAQAALMAKGVKDAKSVAATAASEAVTVASSYLSSFGSLIDGLFQKQSDAVTQAVEKVNRLHDLIGGLSTETVDAATLSGKALVDAYKDGKVAAEDLSEGQRAQLEKTLKMQEKAAEKEADIKKKSAMQSWEISQGVAIATAIMQASLALVNALATPPLNPVTVAATVFAAGTAVAQVASAQPPSFRGGGMVSDAAPSASSSLPDARIISAEVGESILTRRGTQAIGGEDGVKATNAGMPPGPVQVNLRLGHRTVDTVYSDLRNRPSSVRESLSRNRGRKNYYIGRG